MRSLSVVVSFLLRTGPAFARSLFALEHQNVCATMRVLPLEMVENSISPCERISGGFSPHSIAQIDIMLHPIDLSACTCFHLHDAAYCHRTGLFLTSFTLNMRIVALVAGDSTALPLLSTVGWFSLLPWLGYAAGSVALPACSLALAAARTQPVAIRGDAQNDSKLATTRGGPRVVETAVRWPRYVVLTLPLHDGRSDSPAR
jgi:hypothetical protein